MHFLLNPLCFLHSTACSNVSRPSPAPVARLQLTPSPPHMSSSAPGRPCARRARCSRTASSLSCSLL
eukprot:3855010-Rhodomonas_salina.3